MGILWGKKALLEGLDAPKLAPANGTAPDLMETGTLNHEGIVGAAAAIEFLASLAAGGGSRREKLAHVSHALHERGAELLARNTGGTGLPGSAA